MFAYDQSRQLTANDWLAYLGAIGLLENDRNQCLHILDFMEEHTDTSAAQAQARPLPSVCTYVSKTAHCLLGLRIHECELLLSAAYRCDYLPQVLQCRGTVWSLYDYFLGNHIPDFTHAVQLLIQDTRYDYRTQSISDTFQRHISSLDVDAYNFIRYTHSTDYFGILSFFKQYGRFPPA